MVATRTPGRRHGSGQRRSLCSAVGGHRALSGRRPKDRAPPTTFIRLAPVQNIFGHHLARQGFAPTNIENKHIKTENNQPKPPANLRPATRKWLKSVLDEYSLEGHHFRLLTLAAEAWDQAQTAREVL